MPSTDPTTFSDTIPEPGPPPIFDVEMAAWQKYANGDAAGGLSLKKSILQNAFVRAFKGWTNPQRRK